MKKNNKSFLLFILMIIFVISVTGCSLGISSSQINPPSWIIGTWSESTDTLDFEFSNDDIIQESVGIKIDYKEALESDSLSISKETSTDSKYSITMSDSSDTSTLSFEKVSDTKLNYSVSSSGVTVGPIELTKE
ncbi:MAG: hypothetical protein ACPKM0_08705 [Pleomorphochaeta sp.]